MWLASAPRTSSEDQLTDSTCVQAAAHAPAPQPAGQSAPQQQAWPRWPAHEVSWQAMAASCTTRCAEMPDFACWHAVRARTDLKPHARPPQATAHCYAVRAQLHPCTCMEQLWLGPSIRVVHTRLEGIHKAEDGLLKLATRDKLAVTCSLQDDWGLQAANSKQHSRAGHLLAAGHLQAHGPECQSPRPPGSCGTQSWTARPGSAAARLHCMRQVLCPPAALQ